MPLATLGAGEGADPYTGFTSSKKQTLVYRAGAPVYELVGPDGNAYVLNAYGDKVDGGDPGNLADQLTPAAGWTLRVTVPTEDLIIDNIQ